MDSPKIDFVVTWVDGNDAKWQKKKEKYMNSTQIKESMNSESRYRDFEIFRYWFRAVERYAPWVNKIFVITDNQFPKWLNKDNRKIRLVNHSDYIEKEKLPLFNSNAIELPINRINGLSNDFVLFNDDMFLNAAVEQNDFFVKGRPKDVYIESPIIATKGSIDHIMVNDIEIINSVFNKREFYKKHWKKVFNPLIGTKLLRTIALIPSKNFSGMWNSHLPVPYKKETFNIIWKKYKSELENTIENKFRTPYDYSHWLMRYWQLASGNFALQKTNFGQVYDLSERNIGTIIDDINKESHKIICINDNNDLNDYTQIKNELKQTYANKFKKKSEFEL